MIIKELLTLNNIISTFGINWMLNLKTYNLIQFHATCNTNIIDKATSQNKKKIIR